MDFDDLDSQISFEEVVARTRSHILRNVSTTGNYDELVEKYSAFQEIAREAKKRGKLISSVLVAAEGIVQSFSFSPETSTSASPVFGVYGIEEEKLLRLLLTMYMHLYCSYPVPTTLQWRDVVHSRILSKIDIISIQKEPKFNSHVLSQSSYLTALFQVLQTRRDIVQCDVESDDGSFVDSQFVYFLKRLLVLGRKTTSRGSAVSSVKSSRFMNEMLQAVRQFINNNTIDCGFEMPAKDAEKRKRGRTNQINKKRKHHKQDDKVPAFMTSSIAEVPFRTLYHYPSLEPFPVIMGDDFPAEPYCSRHDDIKSSIHWGQRKLMLSEIQFLSMYCEHETSYHIVYAGAAPGTHLGFLDDMFKGRHTWELIDPGLFDHIVFENRSNFSLRNEFFTNRTAYDINARRLEEVLPALGSIYRFITLDSMSHSTKEIHESLQSAIGTQNVARGTKDIPSMYEPLLHLPRGFELLCIVGMERNKPLLFISDIRSGSLELPNFEDHVAENMRAQEAWTNILQGTYSMLKFRLPYTRKAKKFGGRDEVLENRLIRADGSVPYLRGDILLPIWTRPTSTEGRLVVPQGAFQKDYNVSHIENQFFFFNARVREQFHFNHFLGYTSDLDHHFDGSAEVMCLKKYLQFMFPHLKDASDEVYRDEVLRVSCSISQHLGITFKNAIYRRNALLIEQARRNGRCETASINTTSDGSEVTPKFKDSVSCPSGQSKIGDDGTEVNTSTDKSFSVHESSQDKCSHVMNEWEASVRRMILLARRELERAIWKANIDESKHGEASGVWVTTII